MQPCQGYIKTLANLGNVLRKSFDSQTFATLPRLYKNPGEPWQGFNENPLTPKLIQPCQGYIKTLVNLGKVLRKSFDP
jgi:hypothetical protein